MSQLLSSPLLQGEELLGRLVTWWLLVEDGWFSLSLASSRLQLVLFKADDGRLCLIGLGVRLRLRLGVIARDSDCLVLTLVEFRSSGGMFRCSGGDRA